MSGEALRRVEKLGHSALAYETAKEKLETKYDGTRQQVARYLEELENFRAILSGNSKDLENFSICWMSLLLTCKISVEMKNWEIDLCM